jgi:small subunit ribosomal protein S17
MRELWDTIAVTMLPRPIGVKPWHSRLPFTFYAYTNIRLEHHQLARHSTEHLHDTTHTENAFACRLKDSTVASHTPPRLERSHPHVFTRPPQPPPSSIYSPNMASLLKFAAKGLPTTAKPLLPPQIHSQKVGVVVSAGLMKGAVKVRVAEQTWNKKFRKHFPSPTNYLVRDPNNSLVPGDVIRITSGHRTSKAIHHSVTAIIAPFGEPVENRPKVLTTEELEAEKVRKRLLKDVRSAQRGRQVSLHRIEMAKKQGLPIPTMEEAMKGLKLYEQDLKERGVGAGKEEKHKGNAGQQMTNKQRRMEERKKTKEEEKAEAKLQKARKQTTT